MGYLVSFFAVSTVHLFLDKYYLTTSHQKKGKCTGVDFLENKESFFFVFKKIP